MFYWRGVNLSLTQISPNGYLELHGDKLYILPFECRIYDILGRVIHVQQFKDSDIYIDIADRIQSGIYYLQVLSEDNIIKTYPFYYQMF